MPDLTPQKTLSVSQKPETTGSAIKKNIESVLSKKYGELDTRHIFDGIDDKDIEDNLETAENTIKTNIDRGALSKNILPKLPNLRDGLALSYAAANKGNNKAATRAREAAYTESVEPLVKKTQTSMLSRELPKIQSTTPKTTVQTPSTAKLMESVEEKLKTTNPVWKSGEKTNAENLIYNGKKPDFANNTQKLIYSGKNNDFTDNIQKVSNTLDGTTGIRFKAIMNKRDEEEKNSLEKELTETDLNAGIKVVKSPNDKYHYDYTDVIMKRLKEVLPDFLNHKITSYDDYYEKNSNWLYSPSLQQYYAQLLGDYIFSTTR